MNRRKEKIRTGVALDENIVKDLDQIVESNCDLGLTRSEVINALLHSYMKSDKDQKTKTEYLREHIIKMRKGLFNFPFFF
jgi:metal-responsive CopG/Arc/MetJ family transcriptional regulator